MNDDAELLRRYVETRSEEAFSRLVERHLGMVYHTALRRLNGDAHQAKDVAQLVFTALSRKARSLADHPGLAGWLYTSSRYAAAQMVRAERRRAVREHTVAMNETILSPSEAADWGQLRPLIDEAVESLSARDRQLLLARFFEGRSLSEVGAEFSLTEDAARMRVTRAVDKLKDFFSAKGIVSTSAALTATLSAQSAVQVPIDLASAITTGVLTQVGTTGVALAAATFFSMNKLSLGLISVVIAASVTTLALQEHRTEQLRKIVEEQSAALARGVPRNPVSTAENPTEHEELVNLRAELASLKATAAGGHTHQSEDSRKVPIAAGLTSLDALGGQGRATPRAAFATQLWAAHAGNIDLEAASLTLGGPARARLEALAATLPDAIRSQYNTPERLMAYLLSGTPHPVGAMQVVSETQQDPNNVILDARWQHEDSAQVNENNVHMRLGSNGWQMVVSSGLVDRVAAYAAGAAKVE